MATVVSSHKSEPTSQQEGAYKETLAGVGSRPLEEVGRGTRAGRRGVGERALPWQRDGAPSKGRQAPPQKCPPGSLGLHALRPADQDFLDMPVWIELVAKLVAICSAAVASGRLPEVAAAAHQAACQPAVLAVLVALWPWPHRPGCHLPAPFVQVKAKRYGETTKGEVGQPEAVGAAATECPPNAACALVGRFQVPRPFHAHRRC